MVTDPLPPHTQKHEITSHCSLYINDHLTSPYNLLMHIKIMLISVLSGAYNFNIINNIFPDTVVCKQLEARIYSL